MSAQNEWGQPIGDPVPGWTPPPATTPATLAGRWCRLEPLGEKHIDDLSGALVERSPASLWTYLPWDAEDRDAVARMVAGLLARSGWAPHAVIADGRALGVASYLRIDPAAGSVEVGGIALGAELQRSTAATEAMFLLMRNAFDLGYRRYEWKCDALNEPSRRAAARLGFHYEGTFEQALVYKGRNRDTAWYAITDRRWPALRAAFETWLDPANFEGGRQLRGLSDLTAGL